MLARSLYPRMVLTLCALLGFFDSAYLALARLKLGTFLLCPVGEGCDLVQQSVWSSLPPGNGVPIAFIGGGGYLLFFFLGLTALQKDYLGPWPLPKILLILASAGIAFCIYLLGVQFFAIKAFCFWCLVSAALELAIWGAAFAAWRVWQSLTDED